MADDILKAGRARSRRGQYATLALITGIGTAALCGCGGESPGVPAADVGPVSAYGVTLDHESTPEEVAFVLLRALHDDVKASQAREQQQKKKEALHLTFSLAAYSTIEKRLLGIINDEAVSKRASLGDDRNEKLYEVVSQWGSIGAHYVDSFPEDLDEARRRMQVAPNGDDMTTHVLVPVEHDPAETNPSRKQTATLDIELAKEPGGEHTYWRVARVSFVRPRPAPTTGAASDTQPG